MSQLIKLDSFLKQNGETSSSNSMTKLNNIQFQNTSAGMTMLSTQRPLVSIGVPVFNGERFLAQALDSLLDQTLVDFELIISDNASTDGTQAICEEYARRDSRIRYIRHKKNIGAPRNWNALVNESRGVFFKWASASDYCVPVMLEKCVQTMQADPGIVLCYGKTQMLDENERLAEIYERDRSFNEDQPIDRFMHVCSQLQRNNIQCGVFRLDVLRLTRLDRLYPSGDMALMAELALYGRFQMLPEVLLFRRQSRGTFTSKLTPLERQQIYDPKAKAPMRLILGRCYLDYFISISRAPISVAEKLRAYQFIIGLARWDQRFWHEILSVFKIRELTGGMGR